MTKVACIGEEGGINSRAEQAVACAQGRICRGGHDLLD